MTNEISGFDGVRRILRQAGLPARPPGPSPDSEAPYEMLGQVRRDLDAMLAFCTVAEQDPNPQLKDQLWSKLCAHLRQLRGRVAQACGMEDIHVD